MAGVTHGLNAVADGVRLPLDFSPSTRVSLLPLVEPSAATPEVGSVFGEICDFYAVDTPPSVFRYMARDPVFLRSY